VRAPGRQASEGRRPRCSRWQPGPALGPGGGSRHSRAGPATAVGDSQAEQRAAADSEPLCPLSRHSGGRRQQLAGSCRARGGWPGDRHGDVQSAWTSRSSEPLPQVAAPGPTRCRTASELVRGPGPGVQLGHRRRSGLHSGAPGPAPWPTTVGCQSPATKCSHWARHNSSGSGALSVCW
jgi:hypothetical protein